MNSAEENGGAGSAGGMEAMLGNILETLGENPELMELAGKLAGLSGGSAEPSEASEPSSADGGSPLAGLTALLGDFPGRKSGGEEEGRRSESTPQVSEKNADSAARAAALLKALRPFMNDQRGESVDRLLQILPTAKTIRTALHLFGSL